MSYQVDYLDVLKAIFLPLDPLGLLLIAGIPLGILILNTWLLKRVGELRRCWWVLPLIIGILVMATLGISWPQAGSGWQLADGQLKLKAPPVTTTLDLRRAQVALVESASPWQPVRRTNGYGTPGLTTGWCKLKNGKKAVVFRYLPAPAMVVMKAGGRYHIIRHPGVEELYGELLRQGAGKL